MSGWDYSRFDGITTSSDEEDASRPRCSKCFSQIATLQICMFCKNSICVDCASSADSPMFRCDGCSILACFECATHAVDPFEICEYPNCKNTFCSGCSWDDDKIQWCQECGSSFCKTCVPLQCDHCENELKGLFRCFKCGDIKYAEDIDDLEVVCEKCQTIACGDCAEYCEVCSSELCSKCAKMQECEKGGCSFCSDCGVFCTSCEEAKCPECFRGVKVDPNIVQCVPCKDHEIEIWQMCKKNKIPGLVLQKVVSFLDISEENLTH